MWTMWLDGAMQQKSETLRAGGVISYVECAHFMYMNVYFISQFSDRHLNFSQFIPRALRKLT